MKRLKKPTLAAQKRFDVINKMLMNSEPEEGGGREIHNYCDFMTKVMDDALAEHSLNIFSVC